jgi:protease IV
VEVNGTITTSTARLSALRQLAEDDSVRAVIVAINSPGGTTAGGEELYEALLTLAEYKPVVAVVNELGASAAYMTAIATDRVFARRLSLIGSIGVLYRHVDAGRLLETIGVDLDKVASGQLKAEPEFDGPISPQARESLDALVTDSFEWFVDIVAERRELSRSQTLALADGRIMTGRMAVDSGLIDDIGGEAEAMLWLAENYGIDADMAIQTAYPPSRRGYGWVTDWIGQAAGEALGIDLDGRMALDGLVSLWHPSAR